MKKRYAIQLIMMILLIGSFGMKAQDPAGAEVKTLWGGSASVSYEVFSGNISNYIKNPIALPITIDMMHKNIVLQLYLNGGFSKIKNTMTFPDGSSWNKGENAWHDFLGFNLGYSVYNTTKVRITPQVGYGFTLISKKWWSGSDIAKHEPSVYNFNFSLCIDIKRNPGLNKFAPYTGMRITIGAFINAADAGPYPEYYNGNSFYFSLGVPILDPWDNIKGKKE